MIYKPENFRQGIKQFFQLIKIFSFYGKNITNVSSKIYSLPNKLNQNNLIIIFRDNRNIQ